MIPHLSHVMTLANGIIGVGVLAMPFCFKLCGIVPATLVLLLSSVLSRLACHFLIKSAVMSRRRNFEFLAFHAFGRTGKFFVELFIIGFLLGTCIAFFVVVGDLGPQIVAKMFNKNPEDIRTSLLVTTATFIVFPLGLLRNIDSLSSVCTATIGFYLCLVIKVIGESTRHIFLGDWYNRVAYWRPGGILQCLPIFAMALFCQTQLFEIYETIPNVSLEKMNQVVRGALNICTLVYLCVGFFGYVAFCTQPFTGNILMSFEPSLSSDMIKMGFVFSVAFSFPLVIFPCRASLNSLLFRRAHTHEPSNYYIPEMRFRCLTLTIVAISLGIGISIPNIEFVLGIVGSTIGVTICLIFPAAFFIAISTKNTNERLMAQAILLFGMSIMVLCTYANLYAMEESSSARVPIATGEPPNRINDVSIFDRMPNEGFPLNRPQLEKDGKIVKNYKETVDNAAHELPQKKAETMDVRREPPIPIERSLLTEGPPVEGEMFRGNSIAATIRPVVKEIVTLSDGVKGVRGDTAARPLDVDKLVAGKETKEAADRQQKNENLIDSDAIKKEESELAAAGDQADIEAAARHEKLRRTLEKHKLEQLDLMQEQKEILKDIKEQAQVFEMENKPKEQRIKKKEEEEEVVVVVESVESNKIPDRDASKPISAKETLSDPPKVMRNESIVRSGDDTNTVAENKKLWNKGNPSETKDETSNVVRSKDSHGPILNALTNRTSKRNQETVVGADTAKKSLELALPIALQLRDQANVSVDEKLSLTGTDSAKREDAVIRRENLAQSESNKRDKRDTAVRESSFERRVNVNEEDETSLVEECQRKVKDSKVETINIPTTEIPSIETIVYLTDQEFTDKKVSLEPGDDGQSNLLMLKKRDLKALRTVGRR